MRIVLSAALLLTVSLTAADQARQPTPMLSVFKTPTCGCCAKWVDHMRQNGFNVHVTDLNDLSAIKTKHGVPPRLQSCHTGLVNGYVVEGHIPAADVKRLIKDKPAVAGIAVPGMPSGSPGMEVPGITAAAYQVLSFDKAGATKVFATHGGR
ncbi:MAG: DUF411 domain-containing protein [Acidobacteriota bacterium]|nr:DUF411 domain-containing protein [Acidobacteriota bacterium]